MKKNNNSIDEAHLICDIKWSTLQVHGVFDVFVQFNLIQWFNINNFPTCMYVRS